jgi:tetratricopeptide (TPR) repeat protein
MSDRQSLEDMLQELLNQAQIKGSLSNADLTQLQTALSGIQVGGNLAIGDITQTLLNLIVYVPFSFKPTETPHNLPHSGTIKFVGRAETLDNLQQMLQQSNQVGLTAIEGMGGVGKTELALQYAQLHLLLGTYPGGICWLRARNEDIGLQVVKFAEVKLGIKPPENCKKLQEQVDFCWSRWHEGKVLLVFDDVSNYTRIEQYLPSQPSRFNLLLTTRFKLDLPQSLTLDVLDEAAALELLQGWIGAEKINHELVDVKELCQRLGYLPLALNLVGRYVKKRKISLAEMLRRLEKKGLKHESLERDNNDPAWTLNIRRGVAAAFELSWEELSEEAQQLGCLLSLFALAPIPWDLVESVKTGQDAEVLEDARVELESLHLLQGENTYDLHQLIREFFQNKLETFNDANSFKSAFVEGVVSIAKRIPETPTLEEVNIFGPSMPQLAEVANCLLDYVSNEDLGWIFSGIGVFWQGQGFYTLAEPWWLACRTEIEKRFGYENPRTAESIYNLASVYFDQGRYEEAEEHALEAWKSWKKSLGEKHFRVGSSLNLLGSIYSAQNRYTEAEMMYKKFLDLANHLPGENGVMVAQGLNNLASVYQSLGDFYEAESLFRKSLEIKKNLLGENHLDVANSIHNLAGTLMAQQQYEEAEGLYRKSIEMKKHFLGEEHPYLAESLNDLAMLYELQKRYVDATYLYLRAFEICSNRLGNQHPWTIKIQLKFANFLHKGIVEKNLTTNLFADNSTIQKLITTIQEDLD